MRACFFKWICNFSYFSPTLIKFRSKAEIVIGLVPEMMMNLSSSPILVNQTKVRLTFLIISNSNQLAKMKNICNVRALFCTFAFTTGNPKKRWLSEFFMTGQVSAGLNHYRLLVFMREYWKIIIWPVVDQSSKEIRKSLSLGYPVFHIWYMIIPRFVWNVLFCFTYYLKQLKISHVASNVPQ